MEDKKKDNAALDVGSAEKDSESVSQGKSTDKRKLDKKRRIYLISTVGLSAFFCAFYYCSMEISSRSIELYYFFPAVMFVYMASLAILFVAYIIYNRGFSRKGVTVDMLPSEWSEEKKLEFIENGKVRLEKSKWLLIFIISLMFTFIAEAFALFVFPMIEELWR